MASHTCEQCGAIVASDEQFCPSCGTFIDPMSTHEPRPRPRPAPSPDNVISVSSDGSSQNGGYEEFSLEEPPVEEQPPPDQPRPQPPPRSGGNGNGNGRDVQCPSCGAINPGHNRHCQECGARLRQGPLPTAPRPAVQATAGVRAALAISGLLLGVILIALFFNIFTGDDPEATNSTTTTSTTQPIVEAGPIDVLSEQCDPQGIGSLICSNLTNGLFGAGNEYQVNWEELEGGSINIRFTFVEPIAITRLEWTNISDDAERFRRNYRASSLSITAQDSLVATPVTLQDEPGTQAIPFPALNTTWLEIEVIDAYQAEVINEDVFDELAIDEIVVVGRPANPSSNTTQPATGSTSTTAGG